MTGTDVKSLSDQQLYDRFVDLSITMGEVYGNRARLFNRYVGQQEEVVDEVRARMPDTSRLFVAALRHENPWVRLDAVRLCIDGARDEAIAVLTQLAGMTFHYIGPIASGALASYIGAPPSGEESQGLKDARAWAKEISERHEAGRRKKGEAT